MLISGSSAQRGAHAVQCAIRERRANRKQKQAAPTTTATAAVVLGLIGNGRWLTKRRHWLRFPELKVLVLRLLHALERLAVHRVLDRRRRRCGRSVRTSGCFLVLALRSGAATSRAQRRWARAAARGGTRRSHQVAATRSRAR